VAPAPVGERMLPQQQSGAELADGGQPKNDIR
jgi:hypothetical protein